MAQADSATRQASRTAGGGGRIGDGWGRLPDRWRAALLLALPFLAGAIALRGLTRTMPTFHAGDEVNYHLPTIEQFARQLWTPDLVHYPAAQTPLFHLLVAAWSRVVGLELWRLRVVELLISYGVALVLYRLLRRYRGLALWPALLLAALFACSPYVFGQSFILVTDNLALLLSLIAIERLLAFDRGGGLAAFAVACGAIGLAVLTRQSAGWLALPAFLVLALHEPRDLRTLASGTALLGVALVPFGLLALSWHGLVPPTADPASCGLCASADGRLGGAGDSRLRAPLYALAIAGVYGMLLHGPALWDELRSGGRRGWRLPLGAAAVGVLVLVVAPLAHRTGDEGWIWRVARSGPEPLRVAWPFWLLVPLGCAVLAMVARRCGWRSLPVLLLGCFLVAQLATRLAYQKYFDPIVLLALLLALRPEQLPDRRTLAGVGAIALLSAGFVLAFVTGVIQYET
jgi:4-amino-4-deoxy-L-arabinose transferase-like glycosyltransferase